MLTSRSRPTRILLFGAIIALFAGLVGPMGSAVAVGGPPVTLTASITGTPTVGQTLTAVAGALSPNNADLTYQWQTTDPATDIPLATSSTFVLTTDQIGKQVQVVITGTANNRAPGVVTSAATTTVQGVFTSAPGVTLDSDAPVVDVPITASVTDSAPVADSYTYEWYADDVLIGGATNAAYTPAAADVTKVLVAKATAVTANYISSTGSSAATSAVVKADFTADPSVTISGAAKVGETLTANASGEAPVGDSYTYQWSADASPITGATSSTYALVAADQGAVIAVAAVAVKAGYNDSAEAVSAGTPAVAAGTFSPGPAATLNTTAPKVGTALKVTPTGSVPTPDSYRYQWYKISLLGLKTPIVGAIGQTYNVPSGALNYKLQAKVTALKAGYTSSSSSSVQTARVNQIILDKSSVSRGQSLKITGKRLRAGQLYRMFIDGKTVYKGYVSSTGTVSRTVTVPTSIRTGSKRVWISGYNKAGVRDFGVVTSVIVN